MADQSLRAFIEKSSDLVEALFRPDQQMLAFFYAEDHAGKLHLIGCPMSNATEELQFRCGTPLMFRRNGWRRWCFFTEAWTAPNPSAGLPKDRPDRMEIIVFAAEELASKAPLIANRQIYTPDGGPRRLMPLVFPQERAAFVVEGPAKAAVFTP